VGQDQVLITLDGSRSALLEVLRGQYFFTLPAEARLMAQRDGFAELTFPTPLLAGRDAGTPCS